MAHTTFKRSLPSDVSSDIHQIIAKALYLRLLIGSGPMLLSRADMQRAAEAEFEYDILDDGSLIFQPVLS